MLGLLTEGLDVLGLELTGLDVLGLELTGLLTGLDTEKLPL